MAGGYDASMLGAMRAAVVASRALHIQRIAAAGRPEELALQYQQQPGGDPDVLSWRDALWLATAGGAQAVGLEVRAWPGAVWCWRCACLREMPACCIPASGRMAGGSGTACPHIQPRGCPHLQA